MARFPNPPEDMGIDQGTVDFINAALTQKEVVVRTFTCEHCGHSEKKLERDSASHTVWCPAPECVEAGRAMWRGHR